MEILSQLIDLVLHLDLYIGQLVNLCGLWSYAILAFIIFCETGLVITPFLPGDSLLFASGAITAGTSLHLGWMIVLLTMAAIVGDAVNYAIGFYAGKKIVQSKRRWIKKEHLDKTHEFFRKHGKMTIVLARFVPIVRTLAPFVAGVGKMTYTEFAVYNITGGCLWVCLFLIGGRLFGNLPIVKEYFSLVIGAIIVISVMPVAFEIWRSRLNKAKAS